MGFWNSSIFKKPRKADKNLIEFSRKAFGYKPKDLSNYKLAITHSSAAKKGEMGIKLSNERLEFLGDAIIDAVIADYLYHKFDHLPEGELTKMKSKLVSRRCLNILGEKIGVAKILKRNLGSQEMHRSMLGNAFEALIGAVYLEKGYRFTDRLLLDLYKRYELEKQVHHEIDYKSKLHEWCQKKKKKLDFVVLHEEQANGTSTFVVEVQIDKEDYGKGKAKSKKHAEQAASQKACKKIFGSGKHN